jgi:hypothetical protein
LWEAGLSADLTGERLYLYGIAGIRFHLPGVPGLFFDLGVQAKEFDVDPFKPVDGVFFDVMYCWKP